jgi:nucleoside-diphosphate-sugar epimerase
MKKILVTGAFGQIGSELVPALQKKYGKETVIALGHKTIPPDFDGIVEKGDTQDKQNLEKIIKKYNISYVIVGELEKSKYPGLDTRKFNLLGHSIFKSKNGKTTIFKINY